MLVGEGTEEMMGRVSRHDVVTPPNPVALTALHHDHSYGCEGANDQIVMNMPMVGFVQL